MKALVLIHEGAEEELKKIGDITYKSSIINGFYEIDTDLSIDAIQRMSYVITAQKDIAGRLY